MTCNEIENRLPAYLESLLSSEEQEDITAHLASCPGCGRAFADLKRAEALVHDLAEVEPPPFFEQRIMSRVREEAGQQRGLLRRLFYPPHIKLPIQALATLLIAVLAIYLYETGDPEMKRMVPLPIPLTELEKTRVAAESPKAPLSPSAAAPVTRASGGNLPEKSRQRFVTPPFEKREAREMAADSQAPVRERNPAAAPPPASAAKEKDAPLAGAEALDKAQQRAAKQDADQAFETLLREEKRTGKMADTGVAAGDSRKRMFAPSPSRMTVAAIKQADIALTVQVGDTDIATREIEARLGQFKARIIEREHHQGSEFLKAEIAEQNVAALLDLLEAIGRVNLETSLFVVPDGNVTVSIKIVSHP